MMRVIYLLSVLLLWPSLSFGQLDEFVKNYFNELEKGKAAIFYSRCGSKGDKRYTATLIIEVGSKKGLLIEARDKSVVNLAAVTLGDAGIIIEETHGGIYTRERVKKLVDEMASHRFLLITPFSAKKIETAKSAKQCLYAP